MPLFRYDALTSDGKTFNGVIDADSLASAKERLRKQQILITELKALKNTSCEITFPPSLLLLFTRETAQLLRAGLPLYESLVTIEEKYRRHKSHPLLLDLCDHLKGGSLLSTALKRYPKTFDQIYLSMMIAAEQSGNLSQTFEQLAIVITRQQRLKKQLFSALAYPAFLASFCCMIICGLIFFIVPSMQELFEGRTLHPMTRIVLGISQWVNAHVHFLLFSLLSLATGLFFFFRNPKTHALLQKGLLNVPFVKSVLLHTSLVRFCRINSMLLGSGVPLLEALNLSRKAMKNILLETAIREAEQKIVAGERLSTALKSHPIIPSLVIRMLAIAEETGKMGNAFLNLAEIYEEEVEKHLSQLSTFLQPAMLIILGAIVGMVILSILLPLTDVSSFVRT